MAITVETLVTQNARALKNFDLVANGDVPDVSCETLHSVPAHVQQRNRRGPGNVRGRFAAHRKREQRLDQVSTVETGLGAQPIGNSATTVHR
jgi:hypothetical protein